MDDDQFMSSQPSMAQYLADLPLLDAHSGSLVDEAAIICGDQLQNNASNLYNDIGDSLRVAAAAAAAAATGKACVGGSLSATISSTGRPFAWMKDKKSTRKSNQHRKLSIHLLNFLLILFV